ncbi:MAG: YgiT-type zinc finger protein [Leptolyngbya sp. SIO1E4]|nr:YgiT-type zinc finger protein [Leptolyngbya sp. SIO1E4]
MFRCQVCASNDCYAEQTSEIFRIEEKFYLVENIPATVCSRCGEETFSRETTEEIRKLLHSDTKPTKSIAVDVFACQPKASCGIFCRKMEVA